MPPYNRIYDPNPERHIKTAQEVLRTSIAVLLSTSTHTRSQNSDAGARLLLLNPQILGTIPHPSGRRMKRPLLELLDLLGNGRHDWIRTSDLFRVN